MFILKIGQGGCRVIGYGNGGYLALGSLLPAIQYCGCVTLPIPPGLVSRSPATLHPSPRRSRERRAMPHRQHTDRQTHRHGEIGNKEKASYIHTCRYIRMVACRIISTILHNQQLTTAKDIRQNRMPKRDIHPSTN